MKEIKKEEIRKFQEEILSWFETNKRDLPWREMPVGISLQERAYRILISEVMLQQTQVSRVIPKYEAWLQAFPTIQSLAKASVSEVLRVWSGLGYNRRALYLQRAAKMIVKKYSSSEHSDREVKSSRFARTIRVHFPQDEKTLRLLPGIGEYTARAVLCFAFNKQIAVVDTNVRKIILTKFQISNLKSQMPNEKEIKEIAEQLLPHGRAYEWNQALMDYSSAVLSKEKVPLKKQSPFKTSNRYFRGQVVKLLLEKKRTTRDELTNLFNRLYGKEDQERFNKVLGQLKKDNFIVESNGVFSLAA